MDRKPATITHAHHRVRHSLGEDGSLDLSAVAFAKEEVVTAKCEPSVKDAKPELRYQFERLGYFCLDADCQRTTDNCKLIFNRTITRKDTWAKETKKHG